jgi:NADH-quinone oxidoreductase subunit G
VPLQDYWLEHQRKGKRMTQEPVHKPKAVVFGPTIVYDAERCIACTRCVRVCDEIVGTTCSTCASAATSQRDHRLARPRARQRLHADDRARLPGRRAHLEQGLPLQGARLVPAERRTICQGCATGCNAVPRLRSAQRTAPYRHRPRDNEAVNKYWMCDDGMLSYKRSVARGSRGSSRSSAPPRG